MAKVLKCDRCGQVYEPIHLEKKHIVVGYISNTFGDCDLKITRGGWIVGSEYEQSVDYAAKMIDLCPKCMEEFGEWFNGHAGEGDEDG